MRIVAIARIVNLENPDKVVGLRLFDVDKIDVKDTTIQAVKSVLSRGAISIENIELVDGELVGTNGSIDRLAKIDTNRNPLGETPIVIIDQVGEDGYIIVSYTGYMKQFSTEDILSIAKENGIANGKVITKNNKEFISAIRGSYNRIEQSQVKERLQGREAYKGQLLENKRPLYPLALRDYGDMIKIFQSRAIIGTSVGRVIYKYNLPFVEKSDIKRGIVCEVGKISLFDTYICKLDLKRKEQLKVLIRALNNSKFRAKIDAEIADKIMRFSKSHNMYDEKLDMIIPDNGIFYRNIIIPETLDNDIVQNDILDEKTLKFYISRISEMNTNVNWVVKIPFSKGLALERSCNSSGISYRVIEPESDVKSTIDMKKIYLEELFMDHRNYQNVIVKGNMMCVAGLDGVYMYDMDKIKAEYNRMIVDDVANKKAKLLGSSYNISVTESGLLRSLTCQKHTIIPDNVLYIGNNSIQLGECEYLTIGESVIDIAENAIDNKNLCDNYKLNTIEVVNCNCELSFIRLCINYRYIISNKKMKIKFTGKRISDSGCAALLARIPNLKLEHNGNDLILNDDDILKVFKLQINNKYENFKWFNRKEKFKVSRYSIEAKSHNFNGIHIARFYTLCDNFSAVASPKVKELIARTKEKINIEYEKKRLEVKEDLQKLMYENPEHACYEDEILR